MTEPTPEEESPSFFPASPMPSKGRKVLGRAGKIAVAIVAVAVLGASAYVYSTLGKVTSNLTTANVIDSVQPADSSGSGATPQAIQGTNILLVGLDSRADAQGNPLDPALLAQLHAGADTGEDNTDTMIVIHIPDGGGKISVVSFPRDSYVDIPDWGKHKLNSAYPNAQITEAKRLRAAGESDSAKIAVAASAAGAKKLVQVISSLSGLHIDHYAQVNLAGFYEISNAIGGVPVCLLNATKDKNSGADFPKGQFTVQGVQALEFVRQRDNLPLGDIDRERRQQAFLSGMANKVLTAGTLTNTTELGALMDAVKKYIVIDSSWDLLQFAAQMSGLSTGNITFSTIPVGTLALQTPSDGVAVQVNPADIKAYFASLVEGSTATPTTTATNSSFTFKRATTASPTPPAVPLTSNGVTCIN
jgi:LCP family protein required for cell wall assembly